MEAVCKKYDGREPCRDELQRFNIAQIREMHVTPSDANGTKAKALKRRSRKIKQRMAARGQEWEAARQNEPQTTVEAPNKTKIRRNLKELEKLVQNYAKSTCSNVISTNMERFLGDLSRCLGNMVNFFLLVN